MKFISSFLLITNKAQVPLAILSGLGLLFASIIAQNATPFLFTALLFGAGLVILLFIYAKKRAERRFTIRLFTFVFNFSVLLTSFIFLYYMQTYGVPYESGGTDDAKFEQAAYQLLESDVTSYAGAKQVIANAYLGTWHSSMNYVIVVAAVHKFIGTIGLAPSTLNPRLLNCFLLALTSIMVWEVARLCCTSASAARFAGFYTGLLPSVGFTTAHLYRDTLIGFLLMATVMLVMILIVAYRSRISMLSKRWLWILIPAILFAGFTDYLREGILTVVPVMAGLMILAQVRSTGARNLTILALAIMAGVFIISGIFGITERIEGFMDLGSLKMEYYTSYRADMGSETGLGTGIYRLPPLLSYPLRVVYASINPVPFPTSIISENYRRLGTVVWYLSLPFLLSALFLVLKKIKLPSDYYLRSVGVAFLTFYLMVALVTLQSRQITMYATLGAILIAAGIEKKQGRASFYIAAMLGLGGAFAVLYSVLKVLDYL